MVKEAAEHAEEDKKRRAVIEARNHADSLLYSTDRSLKEHGDKVPACRQQAIETAMADLKAVLDSEDADAIRSKTEALAQVSMKLGEAMYKAQQEAGGAGTPGDDAGGGPAGGAGPARAWSTPSSRRSTTSASARPEACEPLVLYSHMAGCPQGRPARPFGCRS